MEITPGMRVNCQLWAEREGGPWTEATLWPADDLPINGWIFEVDEPISIEGLREQDDLKVEGRVFYIDKFEDDPSKGPVAFVGTTRRNGVVCVPVGALRKLEALERLAAEGAP
jgi:hypothetical protein